MIDIPDGMSDEEFHDFYWSKTEEERLEITRTLARQSHENGFITDEEFAEREVKLDRHAKIIENLKRAKELIAIVEREKQLIEDRINARYADMMETASPTFFDDVENKKSH